MTTKLDMLTKLKKQKCLDNSDLLEDKKKMASIPTIVNEIRYFFISCKYSS